MLENKETFCRLWSMSALLLSLNQGQDIYSQNFTLVVITGTMQMGQKIQWAGLLMEQVQARESGYLPKNHWPLSQIISSRNLFPIYMGGWIMWRDTPFPLHPMLSLPVRVEEIVWKIDWKAQVALFLPQVGVLRYLEVIQDPQMLDKCRLLIQWQRKSIKYYWIWNWVSMMIMRRYNLKLQSKLALGASPPPKIHQRKLFLSRNMTVVHVFSKNLERNEDQTKTGIFYYRRRPRF